MREDTTSHLISSRLISSRLVSQVGLESIRAISVHLRAPCKSSAKRHRSLESGSPARSHSSNSLNTSSSNNGKSGGGEQFARMATACCRRCSPFATVPQQQVRSGQDRIRSDERREKIR